MDLHPLGSVSLVDNIFCRCVEDAQEAIMITSVTGILIYVNTFWSKIYGYPAEDALGKKPSILHSGLHNAQFYARMWEQIKINGFWKGNLVNKSKNGEFVPVFLTITSYKNQEGEVIGYMGIALDVTPIRKLETKIRHQERLANIGALASGIAHEIGTPLAIIRGRAEMLMENSHSIEQNHKWLEIIVSQIDRISGLISTLLNLARANDETKIQVCQIKETLNEILMLIESKLSGLNIATKTSNNLDLVVKIGHTQLQQILLNLSLNAIQAIEESIKIHPSKTRLISYDVNVTQTDEKYAEIKVTDTGSGIKQEHLNQLFLEFFTTKDPNLGTGLGLSVTHDIVKSAGGTIGVDSAHGEGATFTIILPLAEL